VVFPSNEIRVDGHVADAPFPLNAALNQPDGLGANVTKATAAEEQSETAPATEASPLSDDHNEADMAAAGA
jgi:hypothetical protein